MKTLHFFSRLAAAITCFLAFPVSAETVVVAASIRPITLLVQDLVQDLPVEVITLLPPNADPHSWAMRVSDRQVLEKADLVLWLGPEFEGFLAKPLAGFQDKQLALGELAALDWPPPVRHDHAGGGRDMHLWLNPANVALVQKALATRLGALLPDARAALQGRLQHQLELLEKLQREIDERLKPYRARGFLAYHDAYGHFVAAFDLRQLGAVNQSSEERLSAKKLQELQKLGLDASCLLAEKDSEPERRLAQTLGLSLVVADGLAADKKWTSYPAFLLDISREFENCLKKSSQSK